jgi:hypothetical protein
MKNISRHNEWLSLIEISGPFLTIPVLEKAFPQGLDVVESRSRRTLRSAYEEWIEAIENEDPDLAELHNEWIKLVLNEVLEYDNEVLFLNNDLETPYTLLSGDACSSIFSPDYIIKSNEDLKPQLFLSIQKPKIDLLSAESKDNFNLSVLDRMSMLCRDTGVNLGIVTNGEQWMLIYRLKNEISGHVSWFSHLWFHEPVTLKAFQSLLGIRRSFGPEEEKLGVLLNESLEHQDELTETLGEQVRRAVEVLIQALDRADEDRNRELLKEVSPEELYDAGLIVMMRLVFLLCAEERGLLLLGDPVYDQFYALSNLRSQLAEDSDQFGPEVLERRYDAWARLLTLFRAVYGGIEHESLRLPALGGSLFNPDRYPFLEGRDKNSKWVEDFANPLPIDNRTVLLLLTSLQVLEQCGGAIFLSYKGLDVEQIGHVYEGLLEYTVVRVPEITLGIKGSQKAQNPNLALAIMENYRRKNENSLTSLLQEITGRSESALRNAISPVNNEEYINILRVCGGNVELAERIRPFGKLLRTDAWGSPIVYRDNSFMVTLGAGRRKTGTHYTPKSLTEKIVKNTLEPIVYSGKIEGKPRKQWHLKSSTELLDLKICDIAMGSGAFLVQVCRWLGEKIVQSWTKEESMGMVITINGRALESATEELLPARIDDRMIIAKRLVAERCLYGVDLNPTAVELAKLSIWLETLAKGRPFGYLDHNFRYGDSLIGIHDINQLNNLRIDLEGLPSQTRIFGQNIEKTVADALKIRKEIRTIPIRDIRDIDYVRRLNQHAQENLESIYLVADTLVAEELQYSGNRAKLEPVLNTLAAYAGEVLEGNTEIGVKLRNRVKQIFNSCFNEEMKKRKPFHWPIEFPEVFSTNKCGFDAIVGNPPFLWGNRISSNLGEKYRDWLLNLHKDTHGNADLSAHFFRRAFDLLKKEGCFGLIATNSISQTDNRVSSLVPIINEGGTIYWALSDMEWPGKAALHVSVVVVHRGAYKNKPILDGNEVQGISSYLNENQNRPDPFTLATQKKKSFKGVDTGGLGFVLEENELEIIKQSYPNSMIHVWPIINGSEFLTHSQQQTTRKVINFSGMSEEEAWEHPYLMEIVKSRVFPYRQNVKRKSNRLNWWLYNEPRPGLYSTIKGLEKVLVNCVVSKHICFGFMPKRMVFTNAINVFAIDKFDDFVILQSTIHELWARYYGSSLETRNRYNPTDCFETYPFPENKEGLEVLGKKYYSCRQSIMENREIGLTETYNLLHSPDSTEQDIIMLRELHAEMDNAIIKNYGWEDLKFEHGFHEAKGGIRYTIDDITQSEVLARLLKLNHKIYSEENKNELSKQKMKKPSMKNSQKAQKIPGQIELF